MSQYANTNTASTFHTPEQVQKAVQDYLSTGMKNNAFELLINFMSGKKPRQWSSAMEDIMLQMIDLAIELRKIPYVKEPLTTYKSVAQSANITSLEAVLTHFLKRAEDYQAKTNDLVDDKIMDMEDLDNEEVDELFISSLSESRTNKDTIRDAWRTLWETYKLVLEIVSKNKKLEDLYASVANKAFEFCKRYKRKTEFKRLCEIIRGTLMNIIRGLAHKADFYKIPFVIDIEEPSTNEKLIAVRFDQLPYAYHFELWQEAIKILEDINTIMQKRKSDVAIKPKILSDYFENLAKMFWKSEFFHFHANVYFSHYTIFKSKNKTLTPEQLSQKSCAFVLSVLCIPPSTNESTLSEESRKNVINLISSQATIQSKAELISYILRHNILELCTNEIKEFFFLVEDSVDVINLAHKSDPLLKKIGETYPQFQAQLRSIIIFKILGQLSKLYTRIKIQNFLKFIGSIDFPSCENIIHLSAITDSIKVKVDHRNQLIIFQDEAKDLKSLSVRLVNFSEDIKEVVYAIEDKNDLTQHEKTAQKNRQDAENFVKSSRSALSKRYALVQELRKPDKDVLNEQRRLEQEAEKQRQAKEKQAQQDAQEKARLAQKEADKQAALKRMEDINHIRKLNLLAELKQIKGFKIDKKKIEDLKDSDIEALTYDKLEKAREQHAKEEKEKEEKFMKNAYKKADYLERARREEHLKTLEKDWKNSGTVKEELVKAHKETHEKEVQFKTKIMDVADFRNTFVKQALATRKSEYEKELANFKKKIVDTFKKEILNQAMESLNKQRADEAAELKRIEEERLKNIERIKNETIKQSTESNKFVRNTMSRSDMQSTTQPAETPKKEDKPSTGGFSRGTGFTRNAEPKKEEEKKPESSGPPKFSSTKAKTGESGPITRNTSSTTTLTAPTTTTTTTIEKKDDGGWRSAGADKKKEPEKKPETKTSTGGGWRSGGK